MGTQGSRGLVGTIHDVLFTQPGTVMEDESFRKVLGFFDLSWEGYRRVRKAVKRRIARRMEALHCNSTEDYLQILGKDPDEERTARELLAVSISRFFRDRRLWEVLASMVLPGFTRSPSGIVRAWCAGCACGEEVYSLRIAWNEVMKRCGGAPKFEIMATDLNPAHIERARTGEYSAGSLKELDPAMVDEYFSRCSDGYRVSERLKLGIQWICMDFVVEMPTGAPFDLVFLRNSLLTYYSDGVRAAVFPKFVDAMAWGSHLVLGNNESVPPGPLPLRRCREYRCIWRKTESNHEDPQEKRGPSSPIC